MSSEHHNLDIHPIPADRDPMFINEPWLIDKSIYLETYEQQKKVANPEGEADNIWIYLPMDLNKKVILRRLQNLIYHYGEANEENEFNFCADVDRLISQIEIYDQIWYARHLPNDLNERRHSYEAIDLVKEFITVLEKCLMGVQNDFLLIR